MQPALEETSITQEPTLTSIVGLEHLVCKYTGDAPPIELMGGDSVLYLRVSTTRQLNTAADVDEDGNSVATQREWGYKKASELSSRVVAEFVDKGYSGQSIEKRPDFKELLIYIDTHPNVRYVILYMRSRIFRNFLDAAIVKRRLQEKGVTVVSAKENFGDGYMGDAMEAITDVVNELQVRMSGEDIKLKMAHKVERGGSVGRAKLGYLNVRKDFDGKLVNTIAVDEKRAPLIKWAFEQYATGQYSVAQLQMMLEDQGLTTRPSAKRAARPLSSSQLAVILRDPYYAGVIRFKGMLYPGRHEPLISKELFLAVQKHLDSRNRRGDRDRIHFHFLRGMLHCAECHDAGRTSRLVYSQNTGHGGTYEYYVCTARQRGLRTMRTVRLDDIETAVARAVEHEAFNTAELAVVRQEIRNTLEEMQASEQEEKQQLRAQLRKLEAQEERLIDLASDGQIDSKILRERLERVTLQKGAVAEKVARTGASIQHGVDRVFASVDLLENPRALYEQLLDSDRRNLLAAFFTRLLVRVVDDELDLATERTEINGVLHELRAHHHFTSAQHMPTKKKRASHISAEGHSSVTRYRPTQSKGLNKPVMVGMTGNG